MQMHAQFTLSPLRGKKTKSLDFFPRQKNWKSQEFSGMGHH